MIWFAVWLLARVLLNPDADEMCRLFQEHSVFVREGSEIVAVDVYLANDLSVGIDRYDDFGLRLD